VIRILGIRSENKKYGIPSRMKAKPRADSRKDQSIFIIAAVLYGLSDIVYPSSGSLLIKF